MSASDSNVLVGRSFLANKVGGQRLRDRIVKILDAFEGDLDRDSSSLEFISTMNDDTIEKIFTCNELLDHVNNLEDDDLIVCKLKDATSHEGLLPRTHSNCNSLPYNVATE